VPADFSEWLSSTAFKLAETRALFDELAGELEDLPASSRRSAWTTGAASLSPVTSRSQGAGRPGAAAAGVQRCSDIRLLDPVDPGRKLQFCRCPHLRVHAADGAHDLDELGVACTLFERRARQTPRPYLVPADLHRTTVVAARAREW
jgi:hypothetical protein